MPALNASRRVVLAGATSLCGKELKQLLEEGELAGTEIRLVDEEFAAGTITEAGGEPIVIQPVDEESFARARFVFFTGSAAFTAAYWQAAQRAGATVIDLTGALCEVPGTVAWIPALDRLLPPQPRGRGQLFASPAAATIVACTLAAAVAQLSVRRLAIVFLQPVSERGQPGIDELESQTVKLLSFQPIDQGVFDAQVAFNLLDRYGEASCERLPEIRCRIAREVRAYLAGRAPLPAIQLVQAPVFYSYSFTAFLELNEAVDAAGLQARLAAAPFRLVIPGEPAPSNVTVAGESRPVLAQMERDPGVECGYWFWGAADNLRLAATNAVQIAEKLLAS